MYLENNEESYAVAKFESMLKENNILFFDVDEFEEIIEYYNTGVLAKLSAP